MVKLAGMRKDTTCDISVSRTLDGEGMSLKTSSEAKLVLAFPECPENKRVISRARSSQKYENKPFIELSLNFLITKLLADLFTFYFNCF